MVIRKLLRELVDSCHCQYLKLNALQIPLQFTSAVLLMGSAGWAEERLARADVVGITSLFFILVLLAATQDIAVDG